MTYPKSRRKSVIFGLALLLVALAPLAALADVAKHRTTGEELEGTLTDQQINKMRVFAVKGGGTRFLNMDEWEITQSEKPAAAETAVAPATGDGGAGEVVIPGVIPGSADSTAAAVKRGKIYIIPISGAIEYVGLVSAVDKAIKEAKSNRSDVVVFRMNTPGGRVDVASEIISMIEGITWARTVAWVQGDERHALSAGAYISLATEAIYMEDAASIGAAVPFRISSGAAEVDEKMQSAFRAKFRALSERRGHMKLLADAMVDTPTSDIVQVFVGDEQQIVTRIDADNLKTKHGDAFKLGKIICGRGKILTMTTNEALELGFITGRVNNQDELIAALGFGGGQVKEAKWLPDQVKSNAEAAQKKFEELRLRFNQNIQLAQDNDPRGHYSAVEFRDGGRLWRQYSQKCLGHLKVCAAALLEIEKLSQDKTIDVKIPQEFLNEAKSTLDTYYRRVNAEKDATRMP